MKNRIYGIEVEYAIKHYPTESQEKKRFLSEADLFELLNKALKIYGIPRLVENKHSSDGYRTSLYGYMDRSTQERTTANRDGMFLGNGARFYMDSGGHPEFATPECLSAWDAVVYDKAGERMLEELVGIAEREMHREGGTGEIFICKNNVDTRGNTYGCHENFLIERKKTTTDESDFFKGIILHLLPFLVTRQIFCGAGKIFSAGRLKYQMSQRSDFIDEEVSSSTTSKRGIINLKDEPLAMREKYRRLHLILGDANMSEYISYLKVGITGLILLVIENEQFKFDLALAEPVQAIKDISADPALQTKVRLRNGRDVSPMEIQREYLKACSAFVGSGTLRNNREILFLLAEWQRLLDGLERDDPFVYRAIDWKIKQKIIDRYLKKQDCTLDALKDWDFFIGKMKDLRLEKEILALQGRHQDLDVIEYLKTRLSQADAIQLRRNLKYLDIHLRDYSRMHRIYHGLLEKDLRYHDIRQDRGLYYILRRSGVLETLGEQFDREVDEARLHPPSNTRARVRGKFIRWMNENQYEGGVRWDSIYLYGKQLKKIDLPSPFKSSYKRVTELMKTYKP
jgi:hypothetical protein